MANAAIHLSHNKKSVEQWIVSNAGLFISTRSAFGRPCCVYAGTSNGYIGLVYTYFEMRRYFHDQIGFPVIVVINLISLWLAPICIERLSLICVNIFFHFTYLQQLSWYVPSNGDVVPLFSKLTKHHITITLANTVHSQSSSSPCRFGWPLFCC